MSTNDDVLIFSSDTTADVSEYRLMGVRAIGGVVKLDELKQNLEDMGPSISGVIESLKKTAGKQGLAEVTISIGINAKGKVGFLGTGGEIGGTATLTLKYGVRYCSVSIARKIR